MLWPVKTNSLTLEFGKLDFSLEELKYLKNNGLFTKKMI